MCIYYLALPFFRFSVFGVGCCAVLVFGVFRLRRPARGPGRGGATETTRRTDQRVNHRVAPLDAAGSNLPGDFYVFRVFFLGIVMWGVLHTAYP